MARSYLQVGNFPSFPQGVSRAFPCVGEGGAGGNATDAEWQIGAREAGTFRNMYMYASLNSLSGTSTIVLRKNATNAGLSLVFSSAQTGIKEDMSNTATVVNTDEINFRATQSAGSGSIILEVGGVEFEPTDTHKCITFMAAAGSSNAWNASGTRFLAPTGGLANTATAESGTKVRMRIAGTASNLFTYFVSNARLNDTTIRTRINGANGAQVLVYATTQTGLKEDTTNTDSIAVDDEYCYSVVTGAGTEIAVIRTVSSTFSSSSGKFQAIAGSQPGTAVSASATRYWSVGGFGRQEATETNAYYTTEMAMTLSDFQSYVSANAASGGSSTLTLRVNAVDASPTLTYSASQTGLKQDTSNTTSVAVGDELTEKVVAASGGTVTLRWTSIVCEAVIPPFIPAFQETVVNFN